VKLVVGVFAIAVLLIIVWAVLWIAGTRQKP
jgi:hypothetical protein